MIDNKATILFRSDDLNGATAEILLRTGTRTRIVKVVECNSSTIDEKLENFLTSEEYMDYKNIVIVGVPFSRKNAELLDKIISEYDIKVIYRDHHEESSHLHKYMWSRILIWDRNGNEISSAKNIFREFVSKSNQRYIRLSILTDLVNASITSHKPEEDIEGSKTIDKLYELAGSPSKFVDNMTEKILSDDAFFNEADILAVIEQEKREEAERQAKIEELRNKRKNNNRGI